MEKKKKTRRLKSYNKDKKKQLDDYAKDNQHFKRIKDFNQFF